MGSVSWNDTVYGGDGDITSKYIHFRLIYTAHLKQKRRGMNELVLLHGCEIIQKPEMRQTVLGKLMYEVSWQNIADSTRGRDRKLGFEVRIGTVPEF